VSVLIVGGYLAHCGRLRDGWGMAMRGLMRVGASTHYPEWPDWFRTDEHLIVRYDVEVRNCGYRQAVRWFRISLADAFAGGRLLARERFEEHEGEIPDQLRSQMRKLPVGGPGGDVWPESLTAAFGDCVTLNFGEDRIATDCGGDRKTAPFRLLLPHYWIERAWWRHPVRVLGFPFALVFDAVTIPLNLAVITLFVLPLLVRRLAVHRRYLWRVGMAVVVTLDLLILTLTLLPLSSGNVGASGLGKLAGVASAMIMALSTFVIPLVAGIVVARETRRSLFVLLGVLAAVASPVALWTLLLYGERVLEDLDLPAVLAWLTVPLALVPCTMALGIALLGCRWATTPRAHQLS
jgi:hypothetical protein